MFDSDIVHSVCANALFDYANVLFDCANALFGCANVLFDCAKALFDCANVLFDCANVLFDCAKVLFDCANVLFECAKALFDFTKCYSISIIRLLFSVAFVDFLDDSSFLAISEKLAGNVPPIGGFAANGKKSFH